MEVDTVSSSTAQIKVEGDPCSVQEVISLVLTSDEVKSLGDATVQLENGSTVLLHALANGGQALQMGDGTTIVHASPSEPVHAVQLQDGRIAYISGLLEAGHVELAEIPEGDLVDTVTINSTDNSATFMEDVELPLAKEDEAKILEVTSTTQSTTTSTVRSFAEKAFRCKFDNCGRLYTTHHHLKVHERSHTGDRPFQCTSPGCSKTFATGYGLKSHTRVHTGETPYPCPQRGCPKSFKTSGDLQKHIRTHTGERPFKCTFEGCDRAFTTSNIRKVHVRTHTGEKPYTCKYEGCGRAFASATNYKNHIRIHTGEKPYECPIPGCHKRFTEYSSLYKHHVVHTHSQPYSCDICGRNYRQPSTLALHKRSTHNNNNLPPPLVSAGATAATTTLEEEEDISPLSEGLDFKGDEEMEELPEKEEEEDISLDFVDEVKDNVLGQDHRLSLMSTEAAGALVTFQTDSKAFSECVDGESPHQQILVVTDPAQLAALQQFAQTLDSSEVIVTSDLDFAQATSTL